VFAKLLETFKSPPNPILGMAVKLICQVEMLGNNELLEKCNRLRPIETVCDAKRIMQAKNSVDICLKFMPVKFSLERINLYTKIICRISVCGETIRSSGLSPVPIAISIECISASLPHSCDPNVFSTFDSSTSSKLIANRPIAIGEEITICVVEYLQSLDKRRESLRLDNFIDCKCSRCLKEEKEKSLDKSPVKISDEELHRPLNTPEEIYEYGKMATSKLKEYSYEWHDILQNIQAHVFTCSPSPAFQKVINIPLLRWFLDLLTRSTAKYEHWFEACPVSDHLGRHYSLVGEIAMLIGEYPTAVKYSRLSLPLMRIFYAGDAEQISRVEKMLKEAEEKCK